MATCRRVMVVEDDRALLELLVDYFEHEGVEVDAIDRPEKALARLREGPRPDVVLLDLRMPKVSGEELLAQIRADPALADLPVALMSGDPARLAFTGRADTLAKPFTIDELNEILVRHCARGADASP